MVRTTDEGIPIAEHGLCPACGNILEESTVCSGPSIRHTEYKCVFCGFRATDAVSQSTVTIEDLRKLQRCARAAWQYNWILGYPGVPLPKKKEDTLHELQEKVKAFIADSTLEKRLAQEKEARRRHEETTTDTD